VSDDDKKRVDSGEDGKRAEREREREREEVIIMVQSRENETDFGMNREERS
jgi:hypothetical protein